MNIYFGETLKELRLKRNLTQEKLSDFLGVSFQTVSKWERGDTYPDITMLPVMAQFFKVSVDELLGVNKAEESRKINEYLEFYDNMRLKDTPLTFAKYQEAVKEFPGEFRLLIRYMELLMCEKTDKDNPDYEKTSGKLLSIYENIQNYCTDDSVRMWAKRLICQHLHTKAYYTGKDEYQVQAEKILAEMPDMVNTREYLSTMLIADMERHYEACSKAIESDLYLFDNAVTHYCFYDDTFSPEYKIEAIKKLIAINNIIFTDGNYGKMWFNMVYNHGHLGHLYFELGDIGNALNHLKICAEFAKQYDNMPQVTERTAQFFEGRTYEKTPRGKTMCERVKILMTERYPLSDEFKASAEFMEIIQSLS